jgi:hypothetical protein
MIVTDVISGDKMKGYSNGKDCPNDHHEFHKGNKGISASFTEWIVWSRHDGGDVC